MAPIAIRVLAIGLWLAAVLALGAWPAERGQAQIAPSCLSSGCAPDPPPTATAGPRHSQANQRSFLPVISRNFPLGSETVLTPPPTPTPTPGPGVDARFAVAVQTATDDAAIANALNRTGSSSWYNWAAPSAAGPPGRVMLLNSGPSALPATYDPQIEAAARARPGSYWLIGSEPNVPGVGYDSSKSLATNAAEYASFYRRYRALVLAADPTARFVVGNALNLDASCGACAGYTSGRSYLDAFLAAYGEPIPADTIWGIHTYRIDWTRLPMVETAEPIREIQAFRAYVNALPGQANKPIWITEFGVIWGFPSVCADGDKVSNCGAPFAADQVDAYLATMLDWLRANGSALRVERWFVFSTYSVPDRYATIAGGIALMDGPSASAQLTRFGRTYAARARPSG